MRNYTFLKSIFICLFVAFTSELSAQAGIGVFSRHLLNPNGEIAIGISERNSLDFIGAGIEYRRNVLEHNLYSFIVGVNLQKMKGEGYTAPPGVFFQVNWKIFKTLIDQEKWTGFFSAGPRLFYVTQSFEPEEGSNDFPIGSVRF